MKQIGRKALGILLALVMALGLLPGAALAEDAYVCVTTEQELIEALNGTAAMIVLSRDIALTKALEVSRTVELYMEDYLLSYSGTDAAVQVQSGTLTMSDGHLSVRPETGDACGVSVADGATFVGEAADIFVYSQTGDACGISAGNAGITLRDYSAVRAESGEGAACAVRMAGGSLTAGYSVMDALSAPGETAWAIDAGSADVTLDRCYAIGQRRTADGYAPAGAVRTEGSVGIETDRDVYSTSSAIYGELSIPTPSDLQDGYYSEDPAAFLAAKYTTEPADEYINLEHEDGIQKLEGFRYHVLPAGSVARIGGVYYGTLTEAFQAAKGGDEVVLLSDYVLDRDVVIPGASSDSSTAKTLRLDLGGHSLTGAGKLVVGNESPLALTVRDTTQAPIPSAAEFRVAENSFLTVTGGAFDVLPTFAGADEDAAKHIFLTGGAFKDDPRALCVPGVTVERSGDYYLAARAEGNVIVVIGEQVLSYDTATDAFRALNAYAAAGDVKAVVSFSGPSLLTADVTLGENLDLTMVYNESYSNKSCIKGAEGEKKPILTVAGAKITSGDAVSAPYGLLLDGVDLVVRGGEITAKTGNAAKKIHVKAIQVKHGDVTVSGGTICADGTRSYDKRTGVQVTEYPEEGRTAAYSDNTATGVDVSGGSLTVSGGSILAVGSGVTGASVDTSGSSITMSGGAVTALGYRHAGDNGSVRYPNDYYQFCYGLRADYYENVNVSVSGGTVKAAGSIAHGVSHNSSGTLTVSAEALIRAEGTAKAYGVIGHYTKITGGSIQAVSDVPDAKPGWRAHYNAVGVQLDYPTDAEGGPSVTGAKITAEATGVGEACGVFSKGYNDWYEPTSPVLKVENCTVSALAQKGFACAVNNDGGCGTVISGGEYSAVCTDGFADCVCAYYSGDLDITGGSFTVQGVEATSKYSEETYAATCVYNQGDGKTTIRGGDFLMKDGNGTVVSSDAKQGTDPSAGDYGAYRLLRVQNPAPERYDSEKGDYAPSAVPTLTVSGGRFSDKVSLTSPNVVAAGYQVSETGDAVYPWTVVGSSGPSYSGGGTTTYEPTITETANGKVTVNPKAAAGGAKVTAAVTPDEGYEVDAVTVRDADGKDVPVTKNADGTYSYTQPKGKVTVSATFKKTAAPEEPGPMAAFTDLDPTMWYRDGVEYCLKNGLMNGVSDHQFNPGGTTTRAMIVTILYRLEGEPMVRSGMPFDDVTESDWYARAVSWAESKGIVNGYSNGKFGPGDPITREQLATVLYRYAQSKGEGFQGLWSFRLDFPDAGDVSDWAAEAVSWMVMNGVVGGKDGKLLPGGDASRAEAATMLMRFCTMLAAK